MVGVGGGDSLRIAWKGGKGTPPLIRITYQYIKMPI